MAVRIVVGRAGVGKSLRCFERIVAEIRRHPLGPPIYWVVPKQSTFATERWLTCRSGLKAFSRCRVVSFDALATEVLSEAGGGKRPAISPKGRLLVLGHLLRSGAPELTHFKASARTPGLASELMSQLDELSRHGQTDRLEDVISALGSDEHTGDASRLLRDKLSDLARLGSGYRQFIGPDRFDKDRRMAFVLSQLGACPRFRGASIHIDGFLDLLDFERRMIVGLAQVAASVEVTFCMPHDSRLLDGRAIFEYPEEDSIFHRAELAHRALRIMLAERQIPVEVHRIPPPPDVPPPTHAPPAHVGRARALAKPELRELEAALSGGTPRPIPHADAVSFIEADSLRTEVDAAAREILSLVRSGTFRFRDVLVLTRDLRPYERHLYSSFTEHGVPFFTDRRRDATCHPFLRLVRAVLAIAVTGFTTEQVVTLCKTGLVPGCDEETAAKLENWAITRGLRGSAWTSPPREAPATPTSPSATPATPAAEDMEALRQRIVALLKPAVEGLRVEGGLSVRDACTRLIELFESLRVRVTLARWITEAETAADFEAAAEHRQVWKELTDLLEELAELLGGERVGPADLQTILLSGLEGLDLGITPATVDQVLVGTAERTRVGDARVVIVLGLSDGIFPRHHDDDRLLSDPERRQLRSMRMSLDDDGSQRQLDERLIGYLAFTRAGERLILTRPVADDSAAALAPSPFWLLAREVCPTVEVRPARPESDATPQDISTPRQLVSALLKWARSPRPEQDAAMTGLYNHLCAMEADGSLLETCRSAVWSALGRENEVALSRETAEKLFPLPLMLTDRQIETFAACPFKHFLDYGLRISEPALPEVDGARVSAIAHGILDWVCENMLEKVGNWDEMPADKLLSEIRRLTDKATARAVTQLTWDGSADPAQLTPRDRHLISRVSTMVEKVARAHQVAAEHTRFRPRLAGARFGLTEEGKPPPPLPALRLQLITGGEAILTGKIDRIDTTPKGDHLAAWDYSLGGHGPSLPRVYRGLDIGILIHLLVLRDASAELLGQRTEPSGAFVLGIRDRVDRYNDIEKYQQAVDADSPEALLARRAAEGLINKAHAEELDPTLTPGGAKSKLFNLKRNKDGSVAATNTNALTPEHLARLLDHAEETIRSVAENIRAGVAHVRPFKLNTVSACVTCGHQKICRFDPKNGGQYDFVELTTAKEVIERLIPPSDSAESHSTPRKGKPRG